jgi:hypothetical protein
MYYTLQKAKTVTTNTVKTITRVQSLFFTLGIKYSVQFSQWERFFGKKIIIHYFCKICALSVPGRELVLHLLNIIYRTYTGYKCTSFIKDIFFKMSTWSYTTNIITERYSTSTFNFQCRYKYKYK